MPHFLSARQHACLKAMGIDVWVHKDYVQPVEQVLPAEVTARQAQPGVPNKQTDEPDWPGLTQQIKRCTACALHATRKQAVVGVGDQQADWMIIGEAPGAEEDRQGEPFVGRAGMLLNAMLQSIGLQRDRVYIANILKCRPPNNRDPKPDEVAQCIGYLQRQIDLIQPRLILAVGRIAAQQLLGSKSSLARMRQKVHWLEPQQIPVIVTYHPAYLLRTPSEKRKAWQDLLFAQSELQRL